MEQGRDLLQAHWAASDRGWERCLQGSRVEVPTAVLGRDVASALKREVPLDAGDLAWVPPHDPRELVTHGWVLMIEWTDDLVMRFWSSEE